MWTFKYDNTKKNSLEHFGIKNQKWGIRRWQNADGSYNEEGKKRYSKALKKHIRNAVLGTAATAGLVVGYDKYLKNQDNIHRTLHNTRTVLNALENEEKNVGQGFIKRKINKVKNIPLALNVGKAATKTYNAKYSQHKNK